MSSFNAPGAASDFDRFLSGITGGQQGQDRNRNNFPSLEQRAQFAQSLGFQVADPSQGTAIRMQNGVPVTMSLGDLTPPSFRTGAGGGNFGPPEGPVGGVSGLLAAMQRDIGAQQTAADAQQGRNNEQIRGLEGFISGIQGDLTSLGQQLSQPIEQLGQEALATGEQGRQEFQDQAQTVQGDLGEGLDAVGSDLDRVAAGVEQANAEVAEANRIADAAIRQFGQAVTNFQSLGIQEASVAAAAIRRNAQSQKKALEGAASSTPFGVDPGVLEQGMFALQQETEQQVQAAGTQLISKTNTMGIQLKGQLAQFDLARAQLRAQGAGQIQQGAAIGLEGARTRLAGEQLRAGTGTQLAQLELQSQEINNRLIGMAASFHQFTAQLQSAALLNAVNLEMQGRTTTAQLVQQNPDSVVSWFNGLLAVHAVWAEQAGVPELQGANV